MHEYLSLSVLTGWCRRGGTEQSLAKRMVALPVVKPWSESTSFRATVCKSQNFQATDKMSIWQDDGYTQDPSIRSGNAAHSHPEINSVPHKLPLRPFLKVCRIFWWALWPPIPVFLLGKFHGQRSLVGYSPQGRKESDTTEHASAHTLL